jgi:hypothetical protein
MSKERTCARCGNRVWETDRRCLYCGTRFDAAPTTTVPSDAPPAAPPEEFGPPTWAVRLVGLFGDKWEAYPKVVLGVLVLTIPLVVLKVPNAVLDPLGVVASVAGLGAYLWVIADLLVNERSGWWIFVCIALGPFLGILAYSALGRGRSADS